MSTGEQINYRVVKVSDELLFSVQGIFLDSIYPHDFYTGDISLVRCGNVVFTGKIYQMAPYGEPPVFSIKQSPVFSINGNTKMTSDGDGIPLVPQEFMEGDEILVTVEEDWDVDYKRDYASGIVWGQLDAEFKRIMKIRDRVESGRLNLEFRKKFMRLRAEVIVPEGTVWRRIDWQLKFSKSNK